MHVASLFDCWYKSARYTDNIDLFVSMNCGINRRPHAVSLRIPPLPSSHHPPLLVLPVVLLLGSGVVSGRSGVIYCGRRGPLLVQLQIQWSKIRSAACAPWRRQNQHSMNTAICRVRRTDVRTHGRTCGRNVTWLLPRLAAWHFDQMTAAEDRTRRQTCLAADYTMSLTVEMTICRVRFEQRMTKQQHIVTLDWQRKRLETEGYSRSRNLWILSCKDAGDRERETLAENRSTRIHYPGRVPSVTTFSLSTNRSLATRLMTSPTGWPTDYKSSKSWATVRWKSRLLI